MTTSGYECDARDGWGRPHLFAFYAIGPGESRRGAGYLRMQAEPANPQEPANGVQASTVLEAALAYLDATPMLRVSTTLTIALDRLAATIVALKVYEDIDKKEEPDAVVQADVATLDPTGPEPDDLGY